jgi:rRNA maturation protein Nop10
MSGIDKPSTEPVIKNMTDGRYELHCPVCGESVIPPLPCPIECFVGYIKRFEAAHKHDGRETAVSEKVN